MGKMFKHMQPMQLKKEQRLLITQSSVPSVGMIQTYIQIDKFMAAEEGTSTTCRSIIDEARASNALIRCRERKRMIPNDQRLSRMWSAR